MLVDMPELRFLLIRHADVAPGRKNDCSLQALDAMRMIMARIIK
jgi:hypothetical protein